MTRRSHIVHEGYRYSSNPHARLQRTPALKLIWHGLPGGLFLLGLAVVATLLIVILSPAASSVDTPRTDGSNVRVAEAGADTGPAQ